MRARTFERLCSAAARRPILTVGIVLALALGGGLLALGLRPSAGIDTFVGSSSASYKATADDERHFGDDAVVILIRESLPNLVETKDLGTLTQLEACLAGQYVVANSTLHAFTPVKAGTHAAYGGPDSPCGHLMKSHATQVVYGPGTFLNRAVSAVNTGIRAQVAGRHPGHPGRRGQGLPARHRRGDDQAEGARRRRPRPGSSSTPRSCSPSSSWRSARGLNSVPSIDDPNFIPQIVFDQTRGVNQPKARFSYLFPTKNSALIQVRLRASLSDRQQAQAISWIRQAIKMPMFRSAYGGRYTITGVPVVINDLASQITGSIAGLLIAALLVMAATLLVVFRNRFRLLPLAVALAATGITFGLLAVLGATLTMASIAVLPILIGLGVDYGIQFQARAQEARLNAELMGEGPMSAGRAVAQAAARSAPAIATAALATGTGFLVLLLSPVPMVRGFGLLLVAGIAVAFLCALTAGSAVLILGERDGGWLGASWRGAGELLGPVGRGVAGVGRRLVPAAPPERDGAGTPGRIVSGLVARPGRLLALAAVLAVIGWVADTQTGVQSDVTKLVPTSMPALHNLNTLEKVTGVSGEIDVTVRSENVATPSTVQWMISYERQLLTHFGYLEEKGCGAATLCPALSLPDLFSSASQSASSSGPSLTQAQITAFLAAVPSYFSQAVITPDHREATLAFGIRLMPLSRQERVIDYMRAHSKPPAGTTAALAGLPVLAAEANAALSSTWRRFLTLVAGLFAVALVLLAVLRNRDRALVPLAPIVMATGWSALILFLIGIPLNPMSATLGTLVIAISTEFSVLLSERYRQERAAGHDLHAALGRTYRSTGAAVLASGVTAIVGFGVLVFSDITMLRDFGFVTLIDLSVSLLGVLLVLPAVLALSERRALARQDDPLRAARSARLRLRRRPRVA